MLVNPPGHLLTCIGCSRMCLSVPPWAFSPKIRWYSVDSEAVCPSCVFNAVKDKNGYTIRQEYKNMIIKIAGIRDGTWWYYEAERITIDHQSDIADIKDSDLCLLFVDGPKKKVTFITPKGDEKIVVFNTRGFILNDRGTTIDSI